MARDRRELWEKRVAQWVQSGLGGAEFAERVGVKEATLRHWKWQLGHESRGPGRRSAPAVPKFIEVLPPVRAPLTGAEAFELVLPGERRLKVPAAFDEAALRRLLAVLEGR